MDNIDKIIEKQLQDELADVIERYHNGEIRREIESKLKRKKKKEELLNNIVHLRVPDFKHKVRELWWMMTKNNSYYSELETIYGNDVCRKTRQSAALFLTFLVYVFVVVLCFTYGWGCVDETKEYYTDILSRKYLWYDTIPFSLIGAFFFLGYTPLVASLMFWFISNWRKIYSLFVLLSAAWLIYFIFLMRQTFPDIMDVSVCAALGFVSSYATAMILFFISYGCFAFYNVAD